VAVWQRVRVGEVFRDGCRDMTESLRWQLGGLKRSLDYKTDSPGYLEPWYGIGTTAAAWGTDYVWHEGQAPATYHIRLVNNPNLIAVDGAFSPQTDPAYNQCEDFRDVLASTGIILHARIVGDADEVLVRVKRLWKPGVKLIVVTTMQDPFAQHQLDDDIHAICS
jgi:hypothetical protein